MRRIGDVKLRAVPAQLKVGPATLLAFPYQDEWHRHMEAMQVLALERPRVAKAILDFTYEIAQQVRRSKIG